MCYDPEDDNLHVFDPENEGEDPGSEFLTAFTNHVNPAAQHDSRDAQADELLALGASNLIQFMGLEAGDLAVQLSTQIGLRMSTVNLLDSLGDLSSDELVEQFQVRKDRGLLPLFAVTDEAQQLLNDLIQTPDGAVLYTRMTFGFLAGYWSTQVKPFLLSEVIS